MRGSIVVLMLLMVMTAAGQGEDSYTWTLYPFTVDLPEGWEAREDDRRLLLGTADDLNAVTESERAEGLVVSVMAAANIAWTENNPLAALSGIGNRPEAVSYGNNTHPTVTYTTEDGDYTISLVALGTDYLLTAVAPSESWEEHSPVFSDLIASRILAEPLTPFHAAGPQLTQTFVLENLRFQIPAEWMVVPVPGNGIQMITSQENRVDLSAQFRPVGLVVYLRDVTALDGLLPTESLLKYPTFYYRPGESFVTPPVETLTLNNIPAHRIQFQEDRLSGQALLLDTGDHVYLFVGTADTERWVEGDSALFEAILSSIRPVSDG